MSNQILQFRQISALMAWTIRGVLAKQTPLQLIGGGVLLLALAFTIQFVLRFLMVISAPLLQVVAVGLIAYGLLKLRTKSN